MNTIIHSRHSFLTALLFVLLGGGSICESFSLQPRSPATRTAMHISSASTLASHNRRRYSGQLYPNGSFDIRLSSTASPDDDNAAASSSSGDNDDDDETATPSLDKAVAASNGEDDKKTSKVRTVLLTVPLFVKFCVVLVIKAVTDLLVYPVLLLWRFATRVKRKILGLLRGNGSGGSKTNGEAAS